MQVSFMALRAFESAARLGSFKLAAQELALTPTAISHHVANLESRLNVNLFYREARRITLTETGKRIAQATTEGFRRIESAIQQAQLAGSVIKVTTTSSLAAMILIPAMQDFSNAYPDMAIEVSTGEALDNQAFVVPLRLGAASSAAPSDILCNECFDVFGAHGINSSSWATGEHTLFVTEWKNRTLPEPPLDAWLEVNELSRSNFVIKKFDQELFGIQQAMLENQLVFCSTTLTKNLLKADLLQQFDTTSVESDLCYYIPYRERLENRNTSLFIDWTERLLTQ